MRSNTTDKDRKRSPFLAKILTLAIVVLLCAGILSLLKDSKSTRGIQSMVKKPLARETQEKGASDSTCVERMGDTFHKLVDNSMGTSHAHGGFRFSDIEAFLGPQSVISRVKDDGSVKTTKLTHAEAQREGYVNLVGILLEKPRLVDVGDSIFLAYPDKTVIAVHEPTCKVSGVYLPTKGEEFHPLVDRIVDVPPLVARDSDSDSEECDNHSDCETGEICSRKECVHECFPSSAAVRMRDGSAVKINKVRMEDAVMGGDIYFTGHRVHDVIAEFIEFDTVQFGKRVSATRDHFLPVFVGNLKRRKTIRFGDLFGLREEYFVRVLDADLSFVYDEINASSVRVVSDVGLYNPYTTSGDIVINDVLVSCHSRWILDDLFEKVGLIEYVPAVYQAMWSPFRWLYWVSPSGGAQIVDDLFPAGLSEYAVMDIMRVLARGVWANVFGNGASLELFQS